MARNTAAEIKVVWEPPETDFDTQINTVAALANRFVNGRIQGRKCEGGDSITETELKDVELMLTAYFLSTRKREVVSGNLLNVSTARQGGFGFAGMMGNHYGQMAIELDCTGTLRDIVARANAAAQGNVDEQAQSSFMFASDADETLLT